MVAIPPDHKNAAAAVPSRSGESHRNDDTDALSMHTTRTDYDYEDGDDDDLPPLPSYDDSVAAHGMPRPVETRLPEPPQDRYKQFIAPENQYSWKRGTKRSSPRKAVGSATSIRMDDRLLDPTQLHDYVEDYLRIVPPRPAVRIQGWHWETVKKDKTKEQHKIYDFDIVLGLERYLPHCEDTWWEPTTVSNSARVYRGSWKKSRAPGSTQDIEVGNEAKPELMDWCEDFCAHKSSLKIFRVSRNITGLDTNFISNRIIPLVRSTHYRGHIDISFPVGGKNVDIYTPHWINRARLSWVRLIFYLTFLWIITWPILFFMTKRWNVYNVEWRFSAWFEDDNGRQRQRYATISETEWVHQHTNLIQSLVLERFHGDGSDMALDVDVNAAMVRARGQIPPTGDQNIDAAVNFLHGGLSAWNSINGRNSGGGWGGDM